MARTMPTPAEIEDFLDRLAGRESVATDAERIDLLSALEALKAGAAAAQARVTVAFDASHRAEQAAAGAPASKQGAGIAAQIALARRDSPHRGGRHLGLAKVLSDDMPQTLLLLARGLISEHRATLLVRETVVLSAEHRAAVDAALADTLPTLGDAGVVREARRLAYRLDPGSAIRRTRGAHRDRRVTIRPAPDTMSYLTGFLPAAQGIAVHTALARHADTLRAQGDVRGRGQIMADTLVERVTGQAAADQVPTEVVLVMSGEALLGDDHTPACLVGYGPVPAALGRDLVRGVTGVAEKAASWVRRIWAAPSSGELIAMESRRRNFDGLLRDFLVIRDEVCRMPWCDAPIRRADHVTPMARGGSTSAAEGQGVCEACNYTKEAPGWVSTPARAGPRHTVRTTTPTGHTYTSTAPEPPGFESASA